MEIKNSQIINVIKKYGPLSYSELYNIFSLSKEKSKKIKSALKKLKARGKIISCEGLLQIPTKKIMKTLKQSSDNIDSPNNDYIDVLKRYKIRYEFPESVIIEARKQLNISEKDIRKRKDFREQLSITIDGEDAKDLDDAIYLEKNGKNYILYVHIADVSYYVKQDKHLDREALRRGTSVYLVDKVVPMLPHTLSNGICSLNEKEDRLCLSAVIELSEKGIIQNYHFCESVINVKKRYTYTEVSKIIETQKEYLDKGSLIFYSMLKEMEKLALTLIINRFKKGSLDFDVDELKIYCDENSNPIEVSRRERLMSHKIIEEFMLKANKCAALFLGEKGNAIYRIHDLPDPDKIKSFFKFMGKLNYKVESDGKVKGTFLQKILEEVKGTKNARVVNTLLLRSMKQAVYHVDNIGHYGLGFKDYTHFTSPIRRYPDLMVHRLIKHKLGIGDKVQKYENKNFLSKIALRSSKTERTAMEAEREIVKIKSARFIEKYIGEVFDGIITGLAEFGFFVQILQFGIEGLIRNRYLNDVFTFDEENYIMRGKNGKTYELGDEIKVQIISVNIKRGFIDFKNV